MASRLIQDNIPLAENAERAVTLAAEAVLVAGTRQFPSSAPLFLQYSFFKTEARPCAGIG